ncbi:MAG: hypothetical protein LUD44_08540 [Firmicutes bacterium]|nr:hypothetical protein [Bacillota bacterium]
MQEIECISGASFSEMFENAVLIGTVGAFLGYAIMRNSGKNGKNDDEKDKK